MLIREEMDRIREQEAASFRSEVEERVEELEGYLRMFREELVKHDGLSRVFATIRQTENVENLPIEYRKVMEWARISRVSVSYLFSRSTVLPFLLADSPRRSTSSSSAATIRPPSSPK